MSRFVFKNVDSDATIHTLIRRIHPRVMIFIIVFSPIVLLGWYVAIFDLHELGVFLISSAMIFFVYSMYALEEGIQFGYDADSIYMRYDGYATWLPPRRHAPRSLRYDDMSLIETEMGVNAAMKRHFIPFETILFRSADMEDDDMGLWLTPGFFKHADEVKDFLKCLAAKRPDLVPQEIIDFMHSDQPL
jgi:hypothetical protein